jgi:hypothetical protein
LAVEKFLDFIAWSKLPLPRTMAALDHTVCMHIETLWADGDGKNWAADCLSGLRHYIPATKNSLSGSWRLYAAWTRAELPQRAPPLTVTFAYAIAAEARRRGWVDTALLLALGWHCYARSGELFAAKGCDFVLDWSSGRGSWTLPLSKSGQRQGIQEAIDLCDRWLVALLQLYVGQRPAQAPLTDVSPAEQRRRLTDISAYLDLPASYSWYSVRRGAATSHMMYAKNLPLVTYRGRWSDAKTAKIYLVDAQATLSELQVAPDRLKRLRDLAKEYRPCLPEF